MADLLEQGVPFSLPVIFKTASSVVFIKMAEDNSTENVVISKWTLNAFLM